MAFKDKAIAGLKSVISAEEAANLQEAADNFRRERDELRAKMAEWPSKLNEKYEEGFAAGKRIAESAQRSIRNEVDKSKAGGWRTRKSRWAVYGAIALAVLGVVVWLASRAQASEPCAPFADLPPDVTMICHAPSGMWVYDSSVWSRYLPTGVRCARPA